MKATIALATIAVAAASVPMSASAVSSAFQQQPLEVCTNAIEQQVSRGEVTDTFHKRLDGGRHAIYANVEKRELDGTRSYQRVTCETSSTGHMVLELSAADGRWVEPSQG